MGEDVFIWEEEGWGEGGKRKLVTWKRGLKNIPSGMLKTPGTLNIELRGKKKKTIILKKLSSFCPHLSS